MEWFRRFGDIPGVDYAGDPRIDRSKLPSHDDVPKVLTYEFDGKRQKSLSWPLEGGSGSASPAHRHRSIDKGDAPASELLLNMMEGLELPGTASDYHFIIQGCAERLWARRRKEPQVFEIVEGLCWLDIRLIEARPNSISMELDTETTFFRVIAFQRLIDLYEREGFLGKALDVATRAVAFQQGDLYAQRLQERIAALEAEDAGAGS
jgi:hypothetical protein